MFVGHTAVAMAAKSRARGVSLGYFMIAAFALDLLWPLFLLAGVEEVRIVPHATAFNGLEFVSYPWSHSLVMAILWGLCAFAVTRWRRGPASLGWLLAGVVVSHWVLDFVTHVQDLPLWPGPSPRLGLRLWDSIPGTLLVEGALFAMGVTLYLHGTRSRDWVGHAGLWGFVLTSTAMWAAGPWSALPPSPRALAFFSLGVWALVAWAWWADAHRVESSGGRTR